MRFIDLQKKDKTNVFPIWTEQASSIRFYYIGFPTCCFLVCVKLVYAQAVLEKIFSYFKFEQFHWANDIFMVILMHCIFEKNQAIFKAINQ